VTLIGFGASDFGLGEAQRSAPVLALAGAATACAVHAALATARAISWYVVLVGGQDVSTAATAHGPAGGIARAA
jgi:hypothetical protein